MCYIIIIKENVIATFKKISFILILFKLKEAKTILNIV